MSTATQTFSNVDFGPSLDQGEVTALVIAGRSGRLSGTAVTSLTVSPLTKSIGDYALSGANYLTSVKLPNRLTSIGEGAFKDAGTVGMTNWFGGRTNLSSLFIPSTVTSVGANAFEGCTNLVSVYFDGKTAAEISAMANYPWGISQDYIYPKEVVPPAPTATPTVFAGVVDGEI